MDIGELRAKIAHLPATQQITYFHVDATGDDIDIPALSGTEEDYDPDGYLTLIFRNKD